VAKQLRGSARTGVENSDAVAISGDAASTAAASTMNIFFIISQGPNSLS